MLILECPNCRSCFKAEEWNKSVIGEPIPESLGTSEEWEEFHNIHTGRADCPECGEVAIYEDMIAV